MSSFLGNMQRNRARSQTAHTVYIYIYKHGNHMHFINITVFITSVRFMVVNLFVECFGFFEIMGEHLLKIQENNIQKFYKKRKHANVSMFISIFSLFLSFLIPLCVENSFCLAHAYWTCNAKWFPYTITKKRTRNNSSNSIGFLLRWMRKFMTTTAISKNCTIMTLQNIGWTTKSWYDSSFRFIDSL